MDPAHVQLSTISAFAFPAITGTHLPTLEGWKKAELAWVAGYVMSQFTCPTAVIHPTTNRVTPYVHSNLAFVLVGAFTKFTR